MLDAAGIFTPLDWYWLAKDGRTYSSARNALVYSYDSAYLAFVAKHGGITPWPVDANGQQTTAALQAVMSQYGITLAI
jgi:hypothetical protein